MIGVEPLFDRVIIRPAEPEKQRGGLYLPETAIDRSQEGEVVAVGPGKRSIEGPVPSTVKPGDRVLFGKFSGSDFELDGERLLIMREEEILAIRRPRTKAARG